MRHLCLKDPAQQQNVCIPDSSCSLKALSSAQLLLWVQSHALHCSCCPAAKKVEQALVWRALQLTHTSCLGLRPGSNELRPGLLCSVQSRTLQGPMQRCRWRCCMCQASGITMPHCAQPCSFLGGSTASLSMSLQQWYASLTQLLPAADLVSATVSTVHISYAHTQLAGAVYR